MQLIHPLRDFNWRDNTSQLFGTNRDIYMSRFGLPGHNGIDLVIRNAPRFGYGMLVVAAHDWDSVDFSSDFPTKTRGNGILLKKALETPEIILGKEAHFVETVYWHLADFEIDHSNKQGKAGEIIGKMGNTGFVLPKPNNTCALCPYLGTHLHFGVRFYDKEGRLIWSDFGGYVNPIPMLYREGDKLPLAFNRNLFWRKSGDDVAWLQTVLRIEGFAKDYEAIGYFGPSTNRDVMALQRKYGINPVGGYVGPKTRKFLNEKYSAY